VVGWDGSVQGAAVASAPSAVEKLSGVAAKRGAVLSAEVGATLQTGTRCTASRSRGGWPPGRGQATW